MNFKIWKKKITLHALKFRTPVGLNVYALKMEDMVSGWRL